MLVEPGIQDGLHTVAIRPPDLESFTCTKVWDASGLKSDNKIRMVLVELARAARF
jgi:hypothetical protein